MFLLNFSTREIYSNCSGEKSSDKAHRVLSGISTTNGLALTDGVS